MDDIREAKDEDRDSAIRLLWKAHEVTSNLEEVRKEHWAKEWHSPEKKDGIFDYRIERCYVSMESRNIQIDPKWWQTRD
jgi:hypothetical protein